MELRDVEPRIRRFIEIRERMFETHWRARLGKHPEREFNKAWRAQCDREHQEACDAYEAYIFWTWVCPTPTCDRCLAPIPAGRREGRRNDEARFCSDTCKKAVWKKKHREYTREKDREYQRRRRRRKRLMVVKPVASPAA